jgi:hypothetical protein
LFSLTLLITLGSALMISPVIAAEPHFSGMPTIAKNSDLSVTAHFKSAALGKKIANVTLSSHATAQIGCVNPGGNSPPPKKVEFEQMQNQTLNIKPEDGKIKGSLTLGPPIFPSASDICPNRNWSTNILSLTYENPSLDIQQKILIY